MADPRYVSYTPKWAAHEDAAGFSALDDAPLVGVEPPYAPRLPTRLIPRDGTNTISALTLRDSVEITQKILTFAAQEAAFGIQYEFSDLRAVDDKVADLARLWIEPFETGSFVIPAKLEEKTISVNAHNGQRNLNSREILSRFIHAVQGAPTEPDFPASLGLINSIKELGRILRREASLIEYHPVGYSSIPEHKSHRILIDTTYIDKVSKNLARRLDVSYMPDSLNGLLTAVDTSSATLKLKLSDGSEVRGTYERTASENVIAALNKNVSLQGVVGRSKKRPSTIRAIFCEKIDK